MESTVAAQCIVEQDTGLVLNMADNKLPEGQSSCVTLLPLSSQRTVTLTM